MTSEVRKLLNTIIWPLVISGGPANISEIFGPLAIGHHSTGGEQSTSTFDL